MASFLKKAQVYLGLGPDDEYDDYDEPEDRAPAPAREAREPREVVATPTRPATAPVARSASSSSAAGRTAAARPAPAGTRVAREGVSRVRPSGPEPAAADPLSEGTVRTLPKERSVESAPAPSKSKSPVRPVAASAKPVVVSPTTFNSAQDVADKFKANQPVILNLQGVERELSRRLLDFCSGICYALSGHMEKVATRVYLLTPANVEVSSEDRRRLTERGLAG
jgi:cell division inhibitor SepF